MERQTPHEVELMGYQTIVSQNLIEEGKIFLHETKYIKIAITKLGKDYFAFEDACTHDGEEISGGILEGDTITCPRHEAQFCIRDGKVKRLPATEPLVILPIRIHNGMVEVDL